MALSFGKGLLYALAGGTKAAAESAVAEDEKRDELSKQALESALKRKALALETAKTLKEKAEAQQRFMDTYAGQNVKGIGMSKAEALRLYEITGGDDSKVPDAIKDGLIKITGAGSIEEVTGDKEGGLDVEAVGAISESKSLFGRGRAEGVANRVKEGMAAQGIDSEGVTMPTTYKASGVGIGNIAPEEEDKGLDLQSATIGTFTIKGADGSPIKVEGVVEKGGKGRRLMVGPDGSYIPAPADAVFNTKTQRTSTDPTVLGQQVELSKMLTKEDRAAAESLANQVNGYETMTELMEQIAPLAMDRKNYSTIAGTIGSISTTVKNEIAGITLLSSEDEGADVEREEGYWQQASANLDRMLADAGDFEQISTNKQLIEALALRLTLADLQATGDTRPSDMDVKMRMNKIFGGSSPNSWRAKMLQHAESTRLAVSTSQKNLSIAAPNLASIAGYLEDTDPATAEAANRIYSTYTSAANRELVAPDIPEASPEEDAAASAMATGIPAKLNIAGMERDAVFDPQTNVFTVMVNGTPRSLSASTALEKYYITDEQIQELIRGAK